MIATNALEEQLKAVQTLMKYVEISEILDPRDLTDMKIGLKEIENDIKIQLRLLRMPRNITEKAEERREVRCFLCKMFGLFYSIFKDNNDCGGSL